MRCRKTRRTGQARTRAAQHVFFSAAAALVAFHDVATCAQERSQYELASTAGEPQDVSRPHAPGLRWSADAHLRDGSLRIPVSMLAQATATERPVERQQPEFGARKSYLIPALQIAGFDFLLNRFENAVSGRTDYDVTTATIRRNFRGGWVTDNDPFKVNQFGHPYQGSMYHGFARSAGLGYWESAGYTFLGSAAWEIAGERTRPSKNDQVASGIAGSFLGEALFRMASLVLESGDGPRFLREIAAATISPPTGFNRLAFGDRFDGVFSSHGAPYYSRVHVGFSGTVQNVQGPSTATDRSAVIADFSMQYGLPGKEGYEYARPFDYFAFDVTATSANVFENIGTRGLLFGKPYGAGDDNWRGIWGLYGSYDYVAPQLYRISTTALSLGSTAQWWMGPSVALQGSALLGVGYGAVGTLHGTAENDYTYGAAPQALLGLRLVFGSKAALDVTGREFFVHDVGGGNDKIYRADVSFTLQVYKQHAIAAKYLWNRRDANSAGLGDRTQTRATFGIFYAYIGKERFGAADWR
jgi:hypothetical protein